MDRIKMAEKTEVQIGTIRIRITVAVEQKDREHLDSGSNFNNYEDGFQRSGWHDSNQDYGCSGAKGKKLECTTFQDLIGGTILGGRSCLVRIEFEDFEDITRSRIGKIRIKMTEVDPNVAEEEISSRRRDVRTLCELYFL
ncbi:unnamed protein product [Caenorhabditis nigoni]